MTAHDFLPVLTVLRHLATLIEKLEFRIVDMQHQIEAMQEEWRHEFDASYEDSEPEEESESPESDSDSDESTQSAPATFWYKRQRTE